MTKTAKNHGTDFAFVGGLALFCEKKRLFCATLERHCRKLFKESLRARVFCCFFVYSEEAS